MTRMPPFLFAKMASHEIGKFEFTITALLISIHSHNTCIQTVRFTDEKLIRIRSEPTDKSVFKTEVDYRGEFAALELPTIGDSYAKQG